MGKVKALWDVNGRGQDIQFPACKGCGFFWSNLIFYEEIINDMYR